MDKKFVEPINDKMYVWVAPDGTMQLTLIAPGMAMLIGITKLLSAKGVCQTAKEMMNKGFTIHAVKADITNIQQVAMDGKLMAELLSL